MSFITMLHQLICWVRSRFLLSGLLLTLTLSGCVRYETDINFQSFNTGELIQHIRLEPQIYQLDRPAVEQWLTSIEQRTQAIGGRIEHPSEQEITAIVPFRTADDLVAKFDRFFAVEPQQSPQITPHLQISHSNFLLASRYHLDYGIDLSSLTPILAKGLANSAPQLQLSLQAASHRWDWPLAIGQPTEAQATFWLINPLGIGGVIIICLVALAYGLRDRLTAFRS
jgi:Protein of unknown function (DUF3153)